MGRVSIAALLAIVLLPCPRQASADVLASGGTYYVRADGSDQADGLTAQTAWRSVSRVNEATLHPGDQVLFRAGDSFPGMVYIPPGHGGTPAAPITFGSYGAGRATINGGTGGAFFAYDSAGLTISNLIFAGSGADRNISDGVSFYNDLPGRIKLAFLRASNIDVSGFGKAGIAIGGWNGSSGFSDVRVTASSAHHNRHHGLITYGPQFSPGTYANSNVYIGHVSAHDNLGDPSLATNSGNGIVLGSVDGGTIERSSAWGNGSLCSATQCGAGIWTYDSTDVTIQYNESYANASASRVDGNGFDLDQNVSSSFVQYNYSHGNGGAGILDYTGAANAAHAGNTIRYNISENDARVNDGAITIGGPLQNDSIYNNTVYVGASMTGGPVALKAVGGPSGVTVRNNILYVTGGILMMSSPAAPASAVVFQQNDYAGAFGIRWGSVTYAGLAAWRQASGQERLASGPSGLTSDPLLTNPGRGGTVGNPDLLAGLTAYRLKPGSPMIASALNLSALFGIDAGSHDFYGTSLASVQGVGACDE